MSMIDLRVLHHLISHQAQILSFHQKTCRHGSWSIQLKFPRLQLVLLIQPENPSCSCFFWILLQKKQSTFMEQEAQLIGENSATGGNIGAKRKQLLGVMILCWEPLSNWNIRKKIMLVQARVGSVSIESCLFVWYIYVHGFSNTHVVHFFNTCTSEIFQIMQTLNGLMFIFIQVQISQWHFWHVYWKWYYKKTHPKPKN